MATSPGNKIKRRQWVVNRPLQFRFVKALVLVLCAMALLSVLAVYAAVWVTVSSFELANNLLIMSLLRSICWLIFLELLIILPFVAWWGIRLSHRVAGPLYRIHAALTRMVNGQYDVTVKLRSGDELQEFTDVINALAASLRSRRST